MADQKLMIAARNKKGQIGYLSEGLSLPEFAELFRSKGDLRILMDYSPVIEELHRLHKVAGSEGILKKYNSLFNFWQDAKTYTKESVKISKSEELSTQANSLINDLHIELQKSGTILSSKWGSQLSESRDVVNNIQRDSNIYIDTLLCFIHSKASLEIASFKNDVTLSGYGQFLEEFIDGIYRRLLRDSRPQDSFLKFIAFEQPKNLQSYLDLEHGNETPDQFLLRTLNSRSTSNGYDEHDGYYREVSIRYPSFTNEFVSIVELFRDLLHKISSVNALLAKLKEGGYQWDDNSHFVDELRENIHLLR
ncbi:hypothetical protein [Massilia sp. WG5]|uniref:hypothetical protein n=1 Tax=Massilia sp. WG5 TaxID=1707785 RepID=UPI000AB442F2|nr:hypothetical protein [Massilia sp. WG5]